MASETPLRSACLLPPSSVDPASDPYAAHLLEILATVDDHSSWSDELAVAAPAWPDSYHLHPSRANVLRSLPLPAEARVLELGARAGGLTRYLGETATLVDALESDPALATIASARCADLETVQVRTGWIDAVPSTPVYDVVIAVDVMGDIIDHDMSLDAFVAHCHTLLLPGGVLVIGADNADGVLTLLGGKPPLLPGTVSRPAAISIADLTSAVVAAGLDPLTLAAFPDHRHAQIVFSHSHLTAVGEALTVEIPKFSVPPTAPTHVTSSSQRSLWASLVDEGQAGGHANSVVVMAGLAEHQLPDVAVVWSVGRAAAQTACNHVRRDNGVAVIARGLAFPDAEDNPMPLQLRPHTEPVVRGVPITRRLLEETSLGRARALLARWAELVRTHPTPAITWDLIPRNVVIGPDDAIHAIDQEWQFDGADADLVLVRGCFWLAVDLLQSPTRPAWLIPGDVGSVAHHLLHMIGVEHDAFWLDTFARCEAEQSAYVAPLGNLHTHAAQSHKNRDDLMAISRSGETPSTSAADASTVDTEMLASLHSVIADLGAENDALRAQVRALELNQRRAALVHRDHAMGLVAEAEALQERLARVQRESRRHKDRSLRSQKQVAAVTSSTTWRIGRIVVRPFSSIRRRTR